MPDTYIGTLRFFNDLRTTPPKEVVLPVRVCRHGRYLLISAGALGTSLCRRTPTWNFQGRVRQESRSLPFSLVVRDLCVKDDQLFLSLEGFPLSILDSMEPPADPFIRGTIHARSMHR